MKQQSINQLCRLAVGASALAGGLYLASAEDAPTDPTAWKTTAAAGVTLTSGNSEALMVSAGILSERKWSHNELSLGAGAAYGDSKNPGEDQSTVNTSSITAFVQYNRLFTERFYGYLRADFLHDDVAYVNYRITLSPGVGYYLIKNDKITLSGEVGPGIVFEELRHEDAQAYWTARFGEKFTWKISERARLWQTFDYQPKIDDWGDYVMNAEIGIATDITKHLDLRVVASDTYRSQPAAGREENDLKLIAGVGYKF